MPHKTCDPTLDSPTKCSCKSSPHTRTASAPSSGNSCTSIRPYYAARRQSQQSDLAKHAMTTSGNSVELRRQSKEEEGIVERVESLRNHLDHTLSAQDRGRVHPGPQHQDSMRPPPQRHGSLLMDGRSAMSVALNDTPATTAPNSPRMCGNLPSPAGETAAAPLVLNPPIRQNSGSSTPRVRATTLDIPGLTKSKVSPDGRIAQRDLGAKLVIVMVGLPARGKSYITKKLARYLNWLQHDTRIFNVGERRRVAAGGPNTLDKTTSQQQKDHSLEPNGNIATPFGLVDLGKVHGTAASASVAQILLNGEAGVEAPGTPPRRTSASSSPTTATNHERETEEPYQQVPDLPTTWPRSMPDTEHMDQSASFFDPANKKAALIREQVAIETLDELLDYVIDQNGSIGILDATNSTLERRKIIMKRIRERAGPELNVLFLESRCLDESLLESNMRLKLNGPDYKDKDPVAALEDFRQRVKVYEKAYVPLGEYEEAHNMPYIQMIDVGRKVISHQIRGFLSAQANYYLLNFNLAPRQIWITRHGLSMDNVSGKIGGDSDLSSEGIMYARTLARFMDTKRRDWDEKQQWKLAHSHFPPQPGDTTPPNPHYTPSSPTSTTKSFDDSASTTSAEAQPDHEPSNFCVWTSMLKRSIQTAQFFNDEEYEVKQFRLLDELNAGTMEGLTYACIRGQHPSEYTARKADKLHYRYPGPGGEGYLDIINRLRPIIVELERMEDHVLLIGHRSVARVLLAYFRGLRREEVADLDVPIGMLYCLEPKPYGVDFVAYRWDRDAEWFFEVPGFQLQRAENDMNGP